MPAKRGAGSKRGYSDQQIIDILAEHERGATIAELSRRYGISLTTLYKWRERFPQTAKGESPAGREQTLPNLDRLAALEEENRRLKQLLGEAMLKNAVLKEELMRESDRANRLAHQRPEP